MRLSVLDQTPVPQGSTAAEALRNSIDLARACDRLGYHRYWVAEHHGMAGLAGAAPEILVGHIAENTESIRVGSGGVMLTHYSPLKVAETFQVLEALHPGRIDLGLGRAPGSDQRTAIALARGGQQVSIEYYPSMVAEVRDLLHRRTDGSGSSVGIEARPHTDQAPEMWLLASSQDSAAVAAHFGLPLSWAHFISPRGAQVCRAYADQFVPDAPGDEPLVSIGVSVLCADTEAEAEALAASLRQWRSSGLRGPIPPPGAADPQAGNPLAVRSPLDEQKPVIAGTAEQCRGEIDALVEAYGADEVLVVSICHDHEARIRSYELLANIYELDAGSSGT